MSSSLSKGMLKTELIVANVRSISVKPKIYCDIFIFSIFAILATKRTAEDILTRSLEFLSAVYGSPHMNHVTRPSNSNTRWDGIFLNCVSLSLQTMKRVFFSLPPSAFLPNRLFEFKVCCCFLLHGDQR